MSRSQRSTPHARPGGPRRLFGPKWLGVTVIALFAGMLFWSKLRVSSVVPRSAYADPEATERTDEDQADGQPPAQPSQSADARRDKAD